MAVVLFVLPACVSCQYVSLVCCLTDCRHLLPCLVGGGTGISNSHVSFGPQPLLSSPPADVWKRERRKKVISACKGSSFHKCVSLTFWEGTFLLPRAWPFCPLRLCALTQVMSTRVTDTQISLSLSLSLSPIWCLIWHFVVCSNLLLANMHKQTLTFDFVRSFCHISSCNLPSYHYIIVVCIFLTSL